MMAVTDSAMPDEGVSRKFDRLVERQYREDRKAKTAPVIPWPQIIRAVVTLKQDREQLVKAVKGEGWSVYRTGKLIRIDIQQGE
jgi:hypothetical protein